MKNINRKNALSLLSKLDSASLSSEERQVLIDLKMLLLEHQDLEDACVADLNGYKAWTIWDGKQDVLDRMRMDFEDEISYLSDADLEKTAETIAHDCVDWRMVDDSCCEAGNQWIASAIQEFLDEDSSLLRKRVENVAEELCWNIEDEGDGSLRFSQESPAGEDFSFSVSSDDLIRQVQEYANDFDISEHVAMWLEARGRVSGVPDAVTLVDDAKEIQAMLDALAEKLSEL